MTVERGVALLRPLGAIAVVAVLLSACSGGAPALPVPPGAVVVRAAGSTFQPAEVTVSPERPVVLYFDNADRLPHNVVAVAPDGSRVFSGDVFSGPAQRVYDLSAIASGTYALQCDVHPAMTATLVVP